MIVDSSVLNGISYAKAANYGMPNIGCHYCTSYVNSHWLDEGARCAVCGKPATNAHHEPAKGTSSTWTMKTPYGSFQLNPSLVALCGSGTTGCHGKRHNGRISFQWVWDDQAMEELWFNGFMLSRKRMEHSPDLYEWGHWEVFEDGEKVAEWRG